MADKTAAATRRTATGIARGPLHDIRLTLPLLISCPHSARPVRSRRQSYWRRIARTRIRTRSRSMRAESLTAFTFDVGEFSQVTPT